MSNDDITTVVAIYGAGLSTIVLIWEVIKYIRDRPNLRLTMQKAERSSIGIGAEIDTSVALTVANIGKESLTISKIGLTLENKTDHLVHEGVLSIELTQNRNHTRYISVEVIKGSKFFHGWVEDSKGKRFKTKKIHSNRL